MTVPGNELGHPLANHQHVIAFSQVKALGTKPGDLGLIPRDRWEGRINARELNYDFHMHTIVWV